MISNIFKIIALFIPLSVICLILAIEMGGVNYFVSPYLKEIFDEYVPELKFERIKYSLSNYHTVTLTDVDYHVSSIDIKASEAKLDVLNLGSLLASINPESSDVFRDLLFDVSVTLFDLGLKQKHFKKFKIHVLKPYGQSIHFGRLKNKQIKKSTNLDMWVDVEDKKFSINAKSVSLANIIKILNQDLSITGLVNGRGYISWRNGLRGYLTLASEDFKFKGVQIDKIINTFSSPAQTSAVDVAAYVALGPLGILTSSVSQIGGGLLLYSGGESYIEDLNITISLFEDKLKLNDVAFSTKENRVSLAGSIKMEDYSFENTNFYVLDEKNCAILSQGVSGTITNPGLKPTVAFINSLVSPFVGLAKSTRLFSCEKVYQGKVGHPKKTK